MSLGNPNLWDGIKGIAGMFGPQKSSKSTKKPAVKKNPIWSATGTQVQPKWAVDPFPNGLPKTVTPATSSAQTPAAKALADWLAKQHGVNPGGDRLSYQGTHPAPTDTIDNSNWQPTPQANPGFSFSATPQSYEALFSQGVGDQYANKLSDLDKRKAEALKQIGFGAQDLSAQLGTSRGQLDDRYTKAIAEQAAAQATLRDAVSKGATSTAKQMAALQGTVGGTGAIDNSRAPQAAALAVGDLAANGQAADTRLRSDQLTQYTLGTRNADIAKSRGVEDQNSSRRGFDTSIADLLDQQAAARQQAAQQGLSQWNTDRNFAYGQYQDQQSAAAAQQSADEQAAKDQADYEQKDRIAQLQYGQQATAKPDAYSVFLDAIKSAGIKDIGGFGKRALNLKRAGGGTNIDSNDIQAQFGNTNAATQAALMQYLKSMGYQVQ